jgi:hypothetical protein
MKDSVVRGCLLQLLYERRSEGSIPFGHAEQAVPPPGGISRRDWLRAVAQLSEYRLIDWTPLEDKSGMGLLSGFAKINDFGVKVLEAGVAPPIRIFIDERQRPTVSRQEQASIATSTPQQQAITDALEKVITAFNQADLSEKDKNAAKSLLRKLLGSKAAGNVLGAGAQSLAAKYSRDRPPDRSAGSIRDVLGEARAIICSVQLFAIKPMQSEVVLSSSRTD